MTQILEAESSDIRQTMRDLDNTTDGLHTALADYIGITFNEKLMDSLIRLRGTLKKVNKHCFVQ